MRSFFPRETFEKRPTEYHLLPFRFLALDETREVLTSLAGEYLVGERGLGRRLADRQVEIGSELYRELKRKHFLYDAASSPLLSLLATKLRTKKASALRGVSLHLFVVTLRCEHTCQYCQVSRQTLSRSGFDMSPERARQAVDVMLSSPARDLTMEFQGGEPLLNFDVIRSTVEYARPRAVHLGKHLRIVIATNLTMATSEMLSFCADNEIALSTSLDGPQSLHDANRPRGSGSSHERVVAQIDAARRAIGEGNVSALMTTTRRSLPYVKEIVDEYVRRGFRSIFLRPLSPHGFAARRFEALGYTADEFVDFYTRGLAYIVSLNRLGVQLEESFAKTLLTKLLTPFGSGYVDLQSPAGMGVSCVAYNFDGGVYASDEGRMLAAIGDDRFRLGTLGRDSYDDLFTGPAIRDFTAALCAEALPGCSSCALVPFCGADPVFHYAAQGDPMGHRPTSDFCRRNMAIIRHLMTRIEDGDEETRRIFLAWVSGRAIAEALG